MVIDEENPDCYNFIEWDSEDCINGGDCEVVSLGVETLDCDPNGNYFLTVFYEIENPTNDFFDLFINNEYIGFYPNNDIPLTLLYEGGSTAPNNFLKICVNDNPDCCATVEYENPCGNNNNNCEIGEVEVEATDCDDEGLFDVVLNFDHANTSDFFTVVGNGNNYGTFSYADLPITITGLEANGMVYEFVVKDEEYPDCSNYGVWESEDCVGGGDCEIVGLEVEAIDCNPNGNYYITTYFEVENTTDDFFDLFINDEFIGFYPIDELAVTVFYTGNPDSGGTVKVCINDNPDCCATVEYENPCGNNNNCEIGEVEVEATDCDDEGLFDVVLNFDHANTSDFFTVVGNGNNYGTFSYADLPITITGLEANGMVYEFVVKDEEYPDCSNFGGWDSEDCIGGGDCEIFDLEVEAFDCDQNGVYILSINFEVENPGNDFFDLYVNNEFLGFHPIANLPMSFTYADNPNSGGIVKVCINDNPNCCKTAEYANPCNNNNNCEIGEVEVEATDCDDEGLFDVILNFDHANTSDFFTVVGNGNNYGTFSYADLPITITGLEANGMVYEFVVKDEEYPDCSNFGVWESEDCSNPSDCEIAQLDVYPLSCNPDGTYSILVLFDYENVDSDLFDVFAAGDYIGSFPYDDLPLTIPSFPASGNNNDVLTVCDSDSEQCCEIAEFEALDCTACNIEEVILDIGACDDQNNFEIFLDLEIEGEGDLGFLVFGNGNNYGNFDYADLPISLGLFDGDGITAYEFIVVDIANSDCVGYAELAPVDCQSPSPVWPGDINNDYISNHYDLLNLGIAFNETGAARVNSDIDWVSFEGEDWNGNFLDGTNWKHADCNGDGVVDNLDLTAIENNYNETHGDVEDIPIIDVLPGSPLFFIDLPDYDDVTLGEAFVAPIILGDIDTPVEEIYGIAFKVRYDPEVMDEAGVYVETGSSWLGEQGSQLISIDKSFADEGLIEVAITRTDHTNVSGFGTISYFIGIIDDIAGKSELSVEITDVVAITYEEARVTFKTPLAVMNLISGTNEILDQAINVFPNPAHEFLTIKTTGDYLPQQITAYNMLGQMVTQIENPTSNQQLEVSNWNSGVYFLDIQFTEGKVSRKVEVLK